MTTDQLTVFIILAITLVLFIYNRWRYDVVAVMALLCLAVFDLVPAEQLFLGFGHPAVITVAAVLLVSQGLINAGVVDSIARQLLKAGDILLVQHNDEDGATPLAELGCLPLAARGLKIGKTPQVWLASCIFVAGLALIALSVLPAATALVLTALVMLLTGILKTNELYSSIDMLVIVLLAAMLPLGMALESSGGSALIANTLLELARQLPAVAVVALLMAATMLLSNIINNAATAVLTAPIAIKLAEGLELSPDPFLMAVAVGASCAFLTPIGHQSNALVMAPGGYKFGDYWRMGLPLSILVLLVAVPVIALVWPLS